MPLRLHETSHDAEAGIGLVATGDEARNNGVKRAFSGGDLVGMPWFQREVTAPVLQLYAGVAGR